MRVRFSAPAAAVAVLLIVSCSPSADPEAGAAATVQTTVETTTTTSSPETSPATSAESTPPAAGDDSCRPVGAGDGDTGQPAAIQFELDAAGNTYPVRLYIPGDSAPATDAGDRLPVVVDWHGLGSDGFQQALLTNYEALAEAEGFIVAHPTGGADAGAGAGAAGLQTGWELAQFDIPGRDDVAMAEALIERLVADYCADPNRVYSTGMSNGGFFTSRLVCELADRIAAAVAVAGVTHPDACSPSRPVPFMAFHGTADAIVPFDGGTSRLESDDSPPELTAFFDQVMPDELAEFAADFDCDAEPEVVMISDEVTAFDYQSCSEGVPVRFVEIDGGGHTWPGSFIGAFTTEALGPTTTDVSATADGWAFMSRFSLDGRIG